MMRVELLDFGGGKQADVAGSERRLAFEVDYDEGKTHSHMTFFCRSSS